MGDPDHIRDLLTDLHSIGKHRGVGEGLVTRWDITETPNVDEWSTGHEHQPGILGRTVPLRCRPLHGPARTPAVAAIRPPYLHPSSRTDAYSPDR